MTQPFLPTSLDEIRRLGWQQVDVIIFSGDAYIDHPSFGAAVIGRILQAQGYKVAIVPQPNWRDDLRDFRKLGVPRLFFGVSPGAMDSMVNHYTAARRIRHDDAYTPGGRHGMRPDYPSIVYAKILKQLYPDVPVVLGGIEASLRRVAHYDYWQDKLLPPLLLDSPADMLIYGMGERTIVQLAKSIDDGMSIKDITDLPQTAFLTDATPPQEEGHLVLASYEECIADKRRQADNFRIVEQESNSLHGKVIWQEASGRRVRINPMLAPMTTAELDAVYDLPFTRLPHPRYRGKNIPAYEMIRHSVTMHRGCFGGCAFCTISAHQGKFISSRSEASVLREVKRITQMPDFKGYISDLGGPSANMYAIGGRDSKLCSQCRRPSCLHPKPCTNLNNDHRPLLKLYRHAAAMPGVKKCFVGSGVRYDLAMAPNPDPAVEKGNRDYLRELIEHHVSGRLKVAPEHTEQHVLDLMRKPPFSLFHSFKKIFDNVNRQAGLNQQLIPYFISSHPGCTEADMALLACRTKQLNFHLEQVQDFTPTPMTVSTETYYTGLHPYTLQPVYTAHTPEDKQAQRQYFFWYDASVKPLLRARLQRLHRPDLAKQLLAQHPQSHPQHHSDTKEPKFYKPDNRRRKK